MTAFQKPANGWLCFFSVLWVVISIGYVIHFALAGNLIGAGLMSLFGFSALGLWFQLRIAAWALILFAGIGIITALLSFGKLPLLRICTRILFAGYGISLLVEYLQQQSKD